MTIRHLLQLAAVAALTMVMMPTASSAQPYPYQYQYDQNNQDYISGRIGMAQPYNVWLGGSNGLHVTMHDGTVITPQGTTLQPGMRVRIWGFWNDDGTFEANQIDVVPDTSTIRPSPAQPYGTAAYGPSRYGPNSTYQGYMTGTVSSFQPYNLWLGRSNGNVHVTLHDGTVINPIGITLEPNMRVRIWGHWNGNGTYEADSIEVVNAGTFGY